MTAPKWLHIALDELGEKEIPGDKDNPRIVEYHDATSLSANDDETPWCASFVGWALKKAGYVPSGSAAARSYLTWGKKVTDPYPGCVIVLSRGQPHSGHVGFFLGSDSSTYFVLGGNQGNKVSIAAYPRGRLLGFREPI